MTQSMVLGGSLSFLVSVIDQLQIVIHLPVLNIEIPPNGMEYFSIIVPIVTYDLLENVDAYNNFIEMLTRSLPDQVLNLADKRRMLQSVTESEKQEI